MAGPLDCSREHIKEEGRGHGLFVAIPHEYRSHLVMKVASIVFIATIVLAYEKRACVCAAIGTCISLR